MIVGAGYRPEQVSNPVPLGSGGVIFVTNDATAGATEESTNVRLDHWSGGNMRSVTFTDGQQGVDETGVEFRGGHIQRQVTPC